MVVVERLSRLKCCLLLVLAVMVTLHVYLLCLCASPCGLLKSSHHVIDHNQDLSNQVLHTRWSNNGEAQTSVLHSSAALDISKCDHVTSDDVINSKKGHVMYKNHTTETLPAWFTFDLEGDLDVIVFLHIQKTGGTTFGRHLVRDLPMSRPCQCPLRSVKTKCDCKNSRDKVWLVSRFSTGWRCGLHADWTELTSCVSGMLDRLEGGERERRYLYVTMLRDPVSRYLSEFKHVQRGATWRAARLVCNGRQASLRELPFCFEGSSWSGVSLTEFMACPHNLANNRQTRMLANLSLIGCYDHLGDPQVTSSQRCTIIQSAKKNLQKLAFFGLTEFQRETKYLFERTFGLKFKSDFNQYNHTHSAEVTVTPSAHDQILLLNDLDIELYAFAKTLFFERLHRVVQNDMKVTASNSGLDVIKKVLDTADLNQSDEATSDEEYEEADQWEQKDPTDYDAYTNVKQMNRERTPSPYIAHSVKSQLLRNNDT